MGAVIPPLASSQGDSSLYYNDVATNPAFNVCREAIDYLTEEIRKTEKKLIELKKVGLPTQMIHGDLHYDNVMVVGDKVGLGGAGQGLGGQAGVWSGFGEVDEAGLPTQVFVLCISGTQNSCIVLCNKHFPPPTPT